MDLSELDGLIRREPEEKTFIPRPPPSLGVSREWHTKDTQIQPPTPESFLNPTFTFKEVGKSIAITSLLTMSSSRHGY